MLKNSNHTLKKATTNKQQKLDMFKSTLPPKQTKRQQQKELKPLPQRGNQRKKLGKQNAPKTKTFKNQQPNTNKNNNKKQKKVK